MFLRFLDGPGGFCDAPFFRQDLTRLGRMLVSKFCSLEA
jgi:hypothetical protein